MASAGRTRPNGFSRADPSEWLQPGGQSHARKEPFVMGISCLKDKLIEGVICRLALQKKSAKIQ